VYVNDEEIAQLKELSASGQIEILVKQAPNDANIEFASLID
jgi:fructoselysine and glucoselysine-specific PTS system IIB component